VPLKPSAERGTSRLISLTVLIFAIGAAGMIPDGWAGDVGQPNTTIAQGNPAAVSSGRDLPQVQQAGQTESIPPAGSCVLRDAAGTGTRTVPVPKRVSGPPVQYPPRTLSTWREDWDDVQCDVDETGHPSNCAVVASEHSKSGVFADLALRYVASSQYAPIMLDGRAVTAQCRFHVTIELKS